MGVGDITLYVSEYRFLEENGNWSLWKYEAVPIVGNGNLLDIIDDSSDLEEFADKIKKRGYHNSKKLLASNFNHTTGLGFGAHMDLRPPMQIRRISSEHLGRLARELIKEDLKAIPNAVLMAITMEG